jgi:hypothetical protein
MKYVKMAALAFVAFGSVACGPSKDAACEGCSDVTLTACESTYDTCGDVSGCKKKDIKTVYADGLCAIGF